MKLYRFSTSSHSMVDDVLLYRSLIGTNESDSRGESISEHVLRHHEWMRFFRFTHSVEGQSEASIPRGNVSELAHSNKLSVGDTSVTYKGERIVLLLRCNMSLTYKREGCF